MDLRPGLYEALVTEALQRAVRRRGSDDCRLSVVDPAELAEVLAWHLYESARRALRSVGGTDEERASGQVAMANDLLGAMARGAEDPDTGAGWTVIPPPRHLTAVAEPDRARLGDDRFPPRPDIPLSQSDLLVNARDERGLAYGLRREIPSADRIDLLCSFIKWEGVRLLLDDLRAWTRPGRRLRILTTTYIGATESRALAALRDLGAEVRVSYDVRRTRLHAKAWLFHRSTGYSTAYIGSSNLSASAMTTGLEWNVRLSNIDAPDLLEKFRRTFDSYWEDGEFEAFDAEAFERARRRERGEAGTEESFVGLDVRPYPFQQEILDRLEAERTRHDRWRNLVVAATGTGKTVIAALDYRRVKRLFDAEGRSSRLLFVAHREEILRQSRTVFRMALGDSAFGELLGAGETPARGEHVFASIQSLAHRLSPTHPAPLGRDDYDVVIIDEVHHGAADTYAALLGHVRPRLLLGVLRARSDRLGSRLPDLPDVPLLLHSRYDRDEALAALGELRTDRPFSLQAGVRWIESLRADVFFITTQKAEGDYSPRTMYRDGALSPTLFQWDSQNATGEDTPTGRRYIEHADRGSRVLLLARRTRRDERGCTAPYVFLGPATYVSHEGSRPMAIRWRLHHPIPAWFYPEARLVA